MTLGTALLAMCFTYAVFTSISTYLISMFRSAADA